MTHNGTRPGARLGRFTLEKRYYGDLDATARGEMLAARLADAGEGEGEPASTSGLLGLSLYDAHSAQ